MVNNKGINDAGILEKIRNNNVTGWEELYEEYAPAMLGIICRLTKNKEKGEKILVHIFTAVAFEDFLKTIHTTLAARLFKYTFHTTLTLLELEGNRVENISADVLPGIFRLVYKKENQSNEIPPGISNKKQRLALLPLYGLNFYSEMICYS